MIKSLSIKNLPGFGQTELNFCPGMNVLTGVNGVGKSRILALISLLLSQIFRSSKPLANRTNILSQIKVGKGVVSVKASCEQVEKPLVLYFSTHRTSFKLAPRKTNSLKIKDFNLVWFIEWWLDIQSAAVENVIARAKMVMVNQILFDCVGWESVFAASRLNKELLIQKRNAVEYITNLSNGERAIAAIVLGLITCLAQANPEMENPARDGKAVVLIDDLDLHLHPKWQRSIVGNLSTAFPNCQFITTTHSSQVISELQPGELTFLLEVDGQVTARPAIQAYGLDANWILEHLMNAHARPEPIKNLIDDIEDLLEESDLDKAREKVAELKEMLHGLDGEAVRLEASIHSLEALAVIDEEPF